jgi:hypothetical protein
VWDAFSGGIVIYRHTDEFRSGAGQSGDLLHRRRHVGGVGIGHRLHHYWCIAADPDPANTDGYSLPSLDTGHGEYSV